MNGILLQFFHWFQPPVVPGSNGKNLWQFLRGEADHLRDLGIDAVWIPPAYKAAGGQSSVGYDVHDHYDTGEFPLNNVNAPTKYGTKQQLIDAINALHGNGQKRRIDVYADIVLNHKAGGDQDDWWSAVRVDKDNRTHQRWEPGWESGPIEIIGYTRFDHADRNGQYSTFTWSSRHFDSVDTTAAIRQNGNEFNEAPDSYIYLYTFNEAGFVPHEKNFARWVSLEKGNYDYLTSCDIDYGRFDVREEMKAWGTWFISTFGFDGVRLDAVKHISGNYMREWVGHIRHNAQRNLFAVGEYIAADTATLHDYLDRMTQQGDFPQEMTLFDFPLFFKFRQASWQGEHSDLRGLFTGTLQQERPMSAVTFVENHDEEWGRGVDSHVQPWFKPLAYTCILLRAGGYPCVFFPDYYGSIASGDHIGYAEGKVYLQLLMTVRRQYALGAEVTYAQSTIAGWVRLGFVQGAKGAMAVVINSAYNRVQRIRMNTARNNVNFTHHATIKWTPGGNLVVQGAYLAYDNNATTITTDQNGWADFPADGGSVSIWIESTALV